MQSNFRFWALNNYQQMNNVLLFIRFRKPNIGKSKYVAYSYASHGLWCYCTVLQAALRWRPMGVSLF